MQQQRTFMDELRYQYKHGGMHIKLLFANVLVFLFIHILLVFGRLGNAEILGFLVDKLFILPTDLSNLMWVPWTLVTSMFAHIDLMHLLLNMLLLFFMGNTFAHFFGERRLLTVYLVGGLAGNLMEILAHLLLPEVFSATSALGASGAIMAIFLGLAFYRPMLPVSLLGIIQIPIIYVGLFFLVADFIRLGANDGVAHFAHLGGALVGFLAARNHGSPEHFLARIERFMQRIPGFFSNFKSGQARRKTVDPRRKTDEEFNMEARERQKKTDEILDKISKSGYESLTKAEKEFLFRQSRK